MFNRENSLKDFQANLLIFKLSICAEEANYYCKESYFVKDDIRSFVKTLTDSDYTYIFNLEKKALEELTALISEPTVLPHLLSRELDLYWIFGYRFKLNDDPAIQKRINAFNEPWGKEITLTLAKLLSEQALMQFVAEGIISFRDLRAWDKGSEKGIEFVYNVLMFLMENKAEVQALLDNHIFNKQSLQLYLLQQGTDNFPTVISQQSLSLLLPARLPPMRD